MVLDIVQLSVSLLYPRKIFLFFSCTVYQISVQLNPRFGSSVYEIIDKAYIVNLLGKKRRNANDVSRALLIVTHANTHTYVYILAMFEKFKDKFKVQ